MRFNSLEEALVAAATSPIQQVRCAANSHLQQIRNENGKCLLQELLQLLKSKDQNIHIIAYSYLLNGWIMKVSRLSYDLPDALQKIYLHYVRIEQQQFTLAFNKDSFRIENLVRLTVAYLVKPQHQRITQTFIKDLFLSPPKLNHENMQFYTRVLQGMNQVLDVGVRMRMGSKVVSLIEQSLQLLWSRGGAEQIRFILAASYYSTLFSHKLFQSMVVLMNEVNINDELVWKIVERLKSAFIDYRFNPSFEKCVQVWQRIKTLASKVNISSLNGSRKLSNGNNFEQVQYLSKVFSDLMQLMQGCLACLLRANMNQSQQQYLSRYILNINEYSDLMRWILSMSSLFQEDCEQEQFNNPLKQTALQTIQMISDRMSEQELNIYFQAVKRNLNSSNQQQIFSLLFGANKHILQYFDCQNIIIKMVTYQMQIPPTGSFIYYLFLGKYLKANEYLISQSLFADIYHFLVRQIELHESMLNKYECNYTRHHMLKISHLLTIGAQLVNYPWTPQYRDYMPFMIKKIFYYLANSFLGIPENAHQNLFESILAIISKANTLNNMAIVQHVAYIYCQSFLGNMIVDLNKQKMTCKIRQELLFILKEALNLTSLKDPQTKQQITIILSEYPEGEQTIIKQLLGVMLKAIKLSNQYLGEVNLTQNYQFLASVQKFGNYLIQKCDIEQSLEQLNMFLVDNYEEVFCQAVSNMVSNFAATFDVLLELSIHETYHPLVNRILIPILNGYYGKHINIIEAIVKKASLKKANIKSAAFQLTNLTKYVQCLLQSLYLNPIWKSVPDPEKIVISNSPLFIQSKNQVDTLYGAMITEMMKQISLEQNYKRTVCWSFRYESILKDSAAKRIIDEWFEKLKS